MHESKIYAQIDMDALFHNYNTIRSLINEKTKLMAVVKADCYGNGISAAKYLMEFGADYFGVSCIDEAMQLRNIGVDKPILNLGYAPVSNVDIIFKNNITQTVFSLEYAKMLNEAAEKSNCKIKCHLKVDTGMTRLGVSCQSENDYDSAVDEIVQICSLKNLYFEGVYTHFAQADETGCKKTDVQYKLFSDLLQRLKLKGYDFEIKHCCNSAGIIEYNKYQMDMVRPGIILYGLNPSDSTKKIDIKPVMTLITKVAQIKNVKKGQTISYGATYEAKEDIVAAVIPIGYADGYTRLLSNKGYVMINGHKAKILGRVCMDQTVVDITGIPDVCIDTKVIVFGDKPSLDELSQMAGTINYELSCIIGKRVPRVYIKDGKEVEKLNYIYLS